MDTVDPADLVAPLARAALDEALLPYLAESLLVVGTDGVVKHGLGPPAGVLGFGDRVGTSVFEYAHPEDLPGVLEIAQRVLDSPPGWHGTVVSRARGADGDWRTVEILVVNHMDDPVLDGIVVRTRVVPTPPTTGDVEGDGLGDLRDAMLLETLVDAVPAAIVLLDTTGEIRYANRAAGDLVGSSVELLRSLGLLAFLPGSDDATALRSVIDELARSRGTRRLTFRLQPRRSAEGQRIVEAKLEARGGPGRTSAIVVVLEDITSRVLAESQLVHRATHDALTGLPNRAAALDMIATTLETSPQGVRVAYCDLDWFKSINDRFGHSRGDEVLVMFGRLLVAAVRPGDLVARLGGDEFIVVSTALDEPGALAISARIREALADYAASDGLDLETSIGWARGRVGDSARSLLHRADDAMYTDKRAHRKAAPDR